jgi:hypothetical protein
METFKPGDMVVVKSSSKPIMRVRRICKDEYGRRMAVCEWEVNGHKEIRQFEFELLEHYKG